LLVIVDDREIINIYWEIVIIHVILSFLIIKV
jgi:hypothetical protein